MDRLTAAEALRDTPGDVLAALHDLVWARPAWHALAACRGQGTAGWFPGRSQDTTVARQTCMACPVRAECADAGSRERHGIWAGATAHDRRHRRAVA